MMYFLGLSIIGIITGLAAGIVGGGAEILIVPLLSIFGILRNTKTRIGTSLFMLLPPIGIMAAMKFYDKNYVDVKAALYMGLLFTIFATVSSKYSVTMDHKLLKNIFAIFTISVGFYMLVSEH